MCSKVSRSKLSLLAAPMNWCLDSVLWNNRSENCLVICGEKIIIDNLDYKLLNLRYIRALTIKIFGRNIYYKLFDYYTAFLIAVLRPMKVILWSESALISLRVAKTFNVESNLYCGSAHRNVYWPLIYSSSEILNRKFRYDSELIVTKNIITESQYALQTFEDNGFANVRIIRPRVFNLPMIPKVASTHDSNLYVVVVPSTKVNKGYDAVLRVINKLGANYRWKIFGSITGGEKLIAEENVKYYGNVSRETFLRELATSDFMLNLSHCDAGPRSVIEAASYGLRIISTSNGIAPELAQVYEGIVLVNSLEDVISALKNPLKLSSQDDTKWSDLFYD